MIPLVTRNNRVDERGRGVKNCGEQNPKSGTVPRHWEDCLSVNQWNRTKRPGRSDSTEKDWVTGVSVQTKLINRPGFHPPRHTLILILLNLVSVHGYSHQPFKWTLSRWEDHHVIQTVTSPGAPTFKTHLCELAPIKPCLNLMGHYLCPSSNPGRTYCNAPNQYYCAYWGCETIASNWNPGAGPDRYLTVKWGSEGCRPPHRDRSGGIISPGNCTHLELTIQQPLDEGWLLGRTWGIRYWEPGTDRGGLIYIKKEIVPNDPDLVGPNEVLAGEISLSSDKGIRNGTDTETTTTSATHINTQEPRGNSLWKLVPVIKY
ncbi:uncharacterized protein LOC127380209 [Apus apus]|uniref:uncharacterized protein LOC127380209 n=1 Tax=Apus apus TaxID=8895 RepID=UPI0021F8436C|nr:uncharacterized protein LOC127380209 [Apus apus]XP_051464798.1 uncharacterized protein LOC127380209 [Apus apus]